MKNLYDSMTETGRDCVACLLGFGAGSSNLPHAAGFRNNMRDIAAPGDEFTIGDAVRLYCEHIAQQAVK